MIATKTHRHFAVAFAVAAVTAALMLCLPNAAWAAEESEPNDSFATADSVSLGQNMYGTSTRTRVSQGLLYSTLEDDEDYYTINVPEKGTYKFTFANDDFGDKWREMYIEMYNQYYERVASFSASLDTTRPQSENLTLSKGVHYVKAYVGSEKQTHQYHFKLTPVINKTSISKVTAGKKAATVKFKKKVGSSKYQVRYSAKSSMKGAKTVTVKKSASSVKIKKLKANKKYYFQVRVVKTLDGKNFYSGWSAKKSVKVKR